MIKSLVNGLIGIGILLCGFAAIRHFILRRHAKMMLYLVITVLLLLLADMNRHVLRP